MLKELELFRELPENLQEIVRPTLVRGSWHAHSYQILTHLLARGDEADREWAVTKTLDLRYNTINQNKYTFQLCVFLSMLICFKIGRTI